MALHGEKLAKNAFTVHRNDTYLNIAAEGEPRQLVPMDAIGIQILEPMKDEKRIRITQEAQQRSRYAEKQAARKAEERQ